MPSAAEGAFDFGALTVSLKRYPDTKRQPDTKAGAIRRPKADTKPEFFSGLAGVKRSGLAGVEAAPFQNKFGEKP